MSSDHYVEVPDPQPKPIAELLADIMERQKEVVQFGEAWPGTAVQLVEEDVPRLVKVLRLVIEHEIVCAPTLELLARILAGLEDDDA